MTNEHITKFSVSNFKKFDRLDVSNIGQVNLITGDNNVGKTSLLEVLLLESRNTDVFKALNYMILSRSVRANTELVPNVGNEDEYQAKNIVGLNQRDLAFPIEVTNVDADGKALTLKLTNTVEGIERQENILELTVTGPLKPNKLAVAGERLVVTERFYNELVRSPFDFSILKMEDFSISGHNKSKSILDRYSEIIKTGSLETGLIKILNKIFPLGINAIRVGVNELEIRTQKQDEYKPIGFFGNGFIKVLKIVLLILRGNSTRVMIDEIDAGIHFSRLKDLWVNVLTLATETQAQLFCTTHSQDCIEAFIEAAEEVVGMKDKVRLIELEEAEIKNSGSSVYASTYVFEQIKAGLHSKVNLRGGKY